MTLRDHEPFIIEQFNGLWERGDDESCPSDHFTVAENIQFFESGFETRHSLDKYQNTTTPLTDIKRIYNYVTQTGQTLLVLKADGQIYHITSPTAVPFPVLPAAIPAMIDFGFVGIAGRAYITPFHSLVDANGQTYELGIVGEFVYVYKGDGTTARKAAGPGPSNATVAEPKGLKSFIAANDTHDGTITKGIHVVGIGYTDATGNSWGGPIDAATQGAAYVTVDAPGNLKIQVNNIPLGPVGTVSRSILLTKAIDPKDYNAGTIAAIYIADTINDNSTTSKIIDIADANLTGWVPYAPNPGPPYTPAAINTSALIVQNTTLDGFCDMGFHIVGVVYETDTGYLTAPGPEFFGANTYIDVKKMVKVMNIPISPDSYVKKRHLVSTKAITDYNGDQKGYQFFFIPKGTLEDNTTTSKTVSYYDSDLVSDASHLLDNYSAIPAGVTLNTYHSRMVLVGDPTYPDKQDPAKPDDPTATVPDTTKPDNRSVARISAPGEPEAISKVDGLIIAPLDGSPLTNCQEFRDILYLFKKTRTYAYSDNGDEPATWQEEVIDQGVGASVHGIASVLDSGGVNIDYLIIADWSGLMLFNGTYARPELSFKIEDFWASLSRSLFRQVQVANDSIGKRIYITLPVPHNNFILYADYANGLDSKSIRWAKWLFDAKMSSVCLFENDKLVLGALYGAV